MKKRLTVLALAFAMVLTMSASVFAAGTNSTNANPSSSATEAELVKYFKAPLGIDLPTSEVFEFVFTPVAPDEHADGLGVPTGTDGFVEKKATIALSSMTAEDATKNQNKIGRLKISEIFAGYNFTRAGEYTFEVKETDKGTENMSYDDSTYKLRLIVNNSKQITDVTVQEGTTKVDPTDVDPTKNDSDDQNGEGGFTFKNVYTKTISNHEEPKVPNPEPTNPDDPSNPTPIDPSDVKTEANAFELDKFVLGAYGDQTKPFEFSVTVELPDAEFVPTGYVLADHASKALSADNKVSIAHGETFTYDTLPIGTKITIAEATPTGYTANWDTSADDHKALTVLVGEKGAYVICRNAFDDNSVTPTGIIINNLPYVLLIGLALGGIVLFSRKRRYE